MGVSVKNVFKDETSIRKSVITVARSAGTDVRAFGERDPLHAEREVIATVPGH